MSKPKTIRVAVYRPGEPVAFEELENTLPRMHALVGGYLEPVYLPDELVLICNEDGKREELPANRAIVNHGIRDVIVGTFFVARRVDPEFASVLSTDEALLSKWMPDTTWVL